MEVDELSKTPVFFIMGRPRSGTSLLSTLFNAHPNIRIAPEFPVMMLLYRKFRKVKKWDEETIRAFVEHAFYHSAKSKISERRVKYLRIDKEFLVKELLKYKETGTIQTFLKSINFYAYSLYEKAEVKWIGDKNPVYTIFANRFRKIFPDAKFICIFRDYRDNFISIKNLAEKDMAIEAPSVPLQVSRWRFVTKKFLKLKKRFPEKYYILKYEDLVTNQEKSFKSLCEFLQIPFDPSVFDFYAKKEETVEVYGSPRYEKFHENLLKPVHTGRIGTWKGVMTDKEVRIADQIAGKYADKLGYQRADKSFNLLLYFQSVPFRIYNHLLLMVMVGGSYLPFKVSQWWWKKSSLFLNRYLRFYKRKKNQATP